MNLAHRIQAYPSVGQTQALVRACGVSRYTWNWALEQCNLQYKENKTFPNMMELKKRWNKEKPEWVLESLRDANSQQFVFLDKALKRFFRDRKKSGTRKVGFPRFKSKHTSRDSFYLSNDRFSIVDNTVILPKIGKVRLSGQLRFQGKIVSGTVSRSANKWFLSVSVEGDFTLGRTDDKVTGVDLGVKTLATLSDGPKPLRKATKRLRRLQRTLSRRKPGSANREKAKRRLAGQHYRIQCIRQDVLHKLTTSLCRENQTIVIEDLHVSGMLRNHCLARAISDIGFYEFRRQFTYKSLRYGTNLIITDRWYPSSKRCSVCGHTKTKLSLSERVYHCGVCGLTIDRDVNAARNLHTLGLREINACGDLSAGCPVRGNETRVVEAGTSMYAVVCA